MKVVKISADLERRLRASSEPLCVEVVKLLDSVPAKAGVTPGIGYKDLVALFRSNLGDALALPPNPSVTWIVRQVNRAKELGLDGDSIRLLCENVRRKYPRPPYDFEWLLRSAPRLLVSQPEEGHRPVGKVFTGRGNQDSE